MRGAAWMAWIHPLVLECYVASSPGEQGRTMYCCDCGLKGTGRRKQNLQNMIDAVYCSVIHVAGLVFGWKRKNEAKMNPLLETEGPTSYLTNDSIVVGKAIDLSGEGEAVNFGGESVDVNLGEEGEVVNLGGEGEHVNLGGKGVDDDNLRGECVDDNLGGEGEFDFLSSDSDLGDIPSENGSDIVEELRDFRQERRNKKHRKKATKYKEIPVGEAGDVDVVRGVDIPARRRSKKVRYDEDCEVSIFELEMVFDGANQFRKAVADYIVEYMNQIKTTYATTQSSQPSSVCVDTTSVPRPPQKRVQVGTGRGLGRKKANARGTTFVTERDNSSSQLLLLSGHKRPYSSASFVAATGGNRRLATDFGVYFDPTTGAQIFNPDTSSEKIPHGPTKLKSASPINIDIDFKPRGLKWKGKDAVSTSQLQQRKANRKNKGSCGTSKK
ncbi:hypothetical protein KY285_035417 [Solanum tuberosum]|nr:hypothetical protein KY285_035417 [Solanum tuberosum]